MILRHFVLVQSRTLTIGSEGQHTYTFVTYDAAYECDLQPATLTESQVQQFGLSDKASNVMRMHYPHDSNIVDNMRVVYEGKTYDVRDINRWTIHDTALLIPVVGV